MCAIHYVDIDKIDFANVVNGTKYAHPIVNDINCAINDIIIFRNDNEHVEKWVCKITKHQNLYNAIKGKNFISPECKKDVDIIKKYHDLVFASGEITNIYIIDRFHGY